MRSSIWVPFHGSCLACGRLWRAIFAEKCGFTRSGVVHAPHQASHDTKVVRAALNICLHRVDNLCLAGWW